MQPFIQSMAVFAWWTVQGGSDPSHRSRGSQRPSVHASENVLLKATGITRQLERDLKPVLKLSSDKPRKEVQPCTLQFIAFIMPFCSNSTKTPQNVIFRRQTWLSTAEANTDLLNQWKEFGRSRTRPGSKGHGLGMPKRTLLQSQRHAREHGLQMLGLYIFLPIQKKKSTFFD